MYHSDSWDSETSSTSDISNISWFSVASDVSSVFADENKDKCQRIAPEKLRFTAQQLAESSASQHFPKFTNATSNKCAKLHWACHVGWCLCKYQYQPLTPLHLLPNTPIPDPNVMLESRISTTEIEPGHRKVRHSSRVAQNISEDQQSDKTIGQNIELMYPLETTV